ncbi:MAG: response regulator transcription factor [Bacteroidetes bacterium]|nr:response regulator transcription factor [Bacteroidota bacterium]
MKIFLVDDSPIVLERLIVMFDDYKNMDIIGKARNGITAIASIRKLKPDIVILDIHMPGGSGIDVLKEVRKEFPLMTVIILTNYADPHYRSACFEAGGDYFLDKSKEFEKVVEICKELIRKNGPIKRK